MGLSDTTIIIPTFRPLLAASVAYSTSFPVMGGFV